MRANVIACSPRQLAGTRLPLVDSFPRVSEVYVVPPGTCRSLILTVLVKRDSLLA